MADDRETGAATSAEPASAEPAFAKINLTLRILGRRSDGYHNIESLVCFAPGGDRVVFRPGGKLELSVRGPSAGDAGARADNLVLKAAQALSSRIEGLAVGRFGLIKRLPVGAGLGGGSADAAAALRLLARANDLDLADARVMDAARATGADVPVCLDPKVRWMAGIGDLLHPRIAMPRLPAVLVFPGVSLATADVFRALDATAWSASVASESQALPLDPAALIAFLSARGNDLEAPALRLAPVVGDVLSQLRAQPDCAVARMSGSGSACFGLFTSHKAAAGAAHAIARAHTNWWVKATTLGEVS